MSPEISAAAALFAPLAVGLFLTQKRRSRPEADIHDLLDRMRQHRYPENLEVLARYWLRTVCGSGYDRREWKILEHSLEEIPAADQEWRQIVQDLRIWMQEADINGRGPNHTARVWGATRSNLSPEVLAAYVGRMLNEWLPLEVSRLLIDEDENGNPEKTGIPAFARARAIERLLVRERLSAGTLEAILQPGLLSPRFVYPADAGILRDVILFLLGRTQAPPHPILPAALLCVPPERPFPPDYGEAVSRGILARRMGLEEIHVSIAPAQASEFLKGDRFRIGSILVTMDGRWWRAHRLLQDGQQDLIAYRPAGQLRIDYSETHAHLRIPWPQARSVWSGPVQLTHPIDIFGCEWHIGQWEQDAEQTWLELVFQRALPLSRITPVAEMALRRSHPASVDMAWASLENALTAAVGSKSLDPIERLRQTELVPTGRAAFSLIETVMDRWLPKRDLIETRLRSISYQQSEIVSTYGRTPWRILPEPVRAKLLAGRADPQIASLLEDIFEGVPTRPGSPLPLGRPAASAAVDSPPHAA